jgi:hypothetical protein
LLQGFLLFPVLLFLSFKLKGNKTCITSKLIGIGFPSYVFVMWIKHAFFWFFALSPLGSQSGNLFETFGAVNSLLTVLFAGLVSLVACLPLFQKKDTISLSLMGASLVLVGVHFALYFLVMFWVPVYFSFVGLTEFWMVALLIPGLVTLFKMKQKSLTIL